MERGIACAGKLDFQNFNLNLYQGVGPKIFLTMTESARQPILHTPFNNEFVNIIMNEGLMI